MPAPAVRDLQELIGKYQTSFEPQNALIDSDIAAAENSGAAQEAGLGAKRDTAFKGIEQAAQNKGMFFSGFSPNEQANYTADTYLPALANLQSTIASTRSNLLGKKADNNTAARNAALGAQENDVQALARWNEQQEQIAAQERAAAAQRAFEADQNAKARAATVSASSARSASSQPTQAQFLVQAFSGYDPGKMSGYTEREVIPALMANYNIDKNAAATLAYNYRKSAYGK